LGAILSDKHTEAQDKVRDSTQLSLGKLLEAQTQSKIRKKFVDIAMETPKNETDCCIGQITA
jgi:hypothetical protein